MKNTCEDCGQESEEGKQWTHIYNDGDTDVFFICDECISKLTTEYETNREVFQREGKMKSTCDLCQKEKEGRLVKAGMDEFDYDVVWYCYECSPEDPDEPKDTQKELWEERRKNE